MRLHGITKASIILDKRRGIEGVGVGEIYPPPPHGGIGGTIHLIIHVRNTHVVFSSGLHFSSDSIYNVGAFTTYRRLNLWVPCFVYNSNSNNIFFKIAQVQHSMYRTL